ncbi:MAG: hypothetical protein R2838_02550 [Caldilineaceae bacterium]
MRSFMLRTAVCDRLCAELCQALVDETDPAHSVESRMDALKRQPLRGRGRRWTVVGRYHHLFQQLLQRTSSPTQYSEDEIRDLHRRAGHWYAEHGFLDEAFAQALAARDLDTAVALVERNRFAMMNRDQWHVLVRWLSPVAASGQTHPSPI